MEIRPARTADLDGIMALIGEARGQLKRLGVDQWQGPYPDRAAILADLAEEAGFVLEEDGVLAGYAYISLGGDPYYDHIDGAWLSGGPYAVLHRVAVGDAWRGRRLADRFFRHTEILAAAGGARSIRMDTHADNLPMQRAIARNGFTYCGGVRVSDGDRLAFEKLI